MSLKANIAANFLGQGWVGLMQLVFIPLYIKYLGMEAYGLIGVFAILQAGLVFLDIGMTPTLNREMARFAAGAHTPLSIRELLHSFEMICLGIAFLIVISIWVTSGWFAQHWLRAENLSVDTVTEAIVIMGLVAALRFIESIYRGAILGLQTQVWLNVVTSIVATARGLGAVGILVWVSPSIEAFFLWQGFISVISVILLAHRVHSALPDVFQPVRFSTRALSQVWKFARGMIITTFLSLMLTQVDKILLSRVLNLQDFGAYILAAAVASALSLIVAPLAQSYYPRFTELLTRNDIEGLIAAYHQGCQFMTIILIPAAMILMFHGETVLFLWTGNAELAVNSAPLVTLLALGTAFLGLMNIPYMLQLTYGWTTLAAKANAVIVVLLIPILLWAAPRYGATGAAWVWLAITSSYILFIIPIMHRRLLPKEMWKWYWRDTAMPAIAAACVAYLGGWIQLNDYSRLEQVAWLITVSLFSLLAALISTLNFQKMLSKISISRIFGNDPNES
jgi:O-antigen/teichoic acid export membrane protein